MDHPRMCGEKSLVMRWMSRSMGSPPRMRGKAADALAQHTLLGITPAYAGKSGFFRLLHCIVWDHPRVCGEKYSTRPYLSDEWGSPPRMRGRVPTARKWSHKVGITPAYAGKRSVKDLGAGGLWDHPRVCGEEVACECGNGYPLGSPPRMRGRVPFLFAVTVALGITPAYAGKSVSVIWLVSQPQDHPRVCGEEKEGAPGRVPPLGSPPRMRGKVMRCSICQRGSGITPAYAGKSLTIQKLSTLRRDHPRVCGEKSYSLAVLGAVSGSPPRMRGKENGINLPASNVGITPAYAGKSMYRTTETLCCRDHPRVCGEKTPSSYFARYRVGSPPRMRGKGEPGRLRLWVAGITPAYAGKSTRPFSSGHENGDHPRVCGEKQN